MNRRNVLGAAVLAVGGGLASLVGIPSLVSAFSPAIRYRRRPAWRGAGNVADFAIGAVGEAIVSVGRDDSSHALEQKTVYVWRRSDQEFVVYSRNCTDLSCPVNFDAGSECFFCPCHGGIFSKEGRPLAGPPKRPLYRYATRVRNGSLEIDLHSLPPIT